MFNFQDGINAQVALASVVLLLLVFADAIAGDAIYRCAINGHLVLTDRPNGNAECQSLDAPASNTFTVEPVRQSATKSASTSRSNSSSSRATHKADESIAADQLKAKQRCQRIEQRLDQIADKMRSGYTVQQGEKLRVQQEQLTASRRIEGCH